MSVIPAQPKHSLVEQVRRHVWADLRDAGVINREQAHKLITQVGRHVHKLYFITHKGTNRNIRQVLAKAHSWVDSPEFNAHIKSVKFAVQAEVNALTE